MLLLATVPAAADELPEYEPDEFDLLFRTAPLDGIGAIADPPAITGDPAVDALIRQIAEGRGYRRRPLASGPLVSADGVLMQPSAAGGWEELQAAARAVGHPIGVTSGYRNHSEQVSIFMSRLAGTSASAIDTRLRTAAAPGYSKHHTGYALDLYAGGQRFTSFGSSAAFSWLSADNADAAKRHGFIPSYPFGAASQGPIPEPWEWVYVGLDVVRCGRATIGMPAGQHDPGVDCPDYPLARGVAADLTWRALGLDPSSADAFGDDDGLAFEGKVNALAEAGLIEGCGPGSFCPFGYLTRGELATWIVATFQLEALPEPDTPFSDIGDTPHGSAIAKTFGAGFLEGCSDTAFCPERTAVRTELVGAILQARNAGLLGPVARFADTRGSVFESDSAWLVAEGITRGCNPPLGDLFCPDDFVTRGQMAAFLRRALGLDPGSAQFEDVAGSVFADDIATLAAAGITLGCNPPDNNRFCPDDFVTRGQMAAFLHRALAGS